MPRYLILWRENPNIQLKDPSEGLRLVEMMFASIDEAVKKGLVEDFGFFPDGTTGYGNC